jgi:hypothetical protein
LHNEEKTCNERKAVDDMKDKQLQVYIWDMGITRKYSYKISLLLTLALYVTLISL